MIPGRPLPRSSARGWLRPDVSLPRRPKTKLIQARPMRPALQRVQLRRTKGWRLPANTLKVDRSTRFGNPFLVSDYGRDHAMGLFRAWLTEGGCGVWVPPKARAGLARQRREILEGLPSLRGKNLACWCPLPEAGEPDLCHGAVLLDFANR
jgi:Domain of unknown function (DUF4326)